MRKEKEKENFSTLRRCNVCRYETFVLNDVPQLYKCRRCEKGLMKIIALSLGE